MHSIVISHSASVKLGNIGKSPVCHSVHLSVRPRVLLHDGWMDFLHIRYHDQVPWTANACKIEFGSVPNLTKLWLFFPKF